LLEHLQMIKEQATGMSKAAQGLNDTLYVSGNSEQKLAAVQSASQKRIQQIARRFAETGFKHLCRGIYHTLRKCMTQKVSCTLANSFATINPSDLPYNLECEIFVDIGENSNLNKIQKLKSIGSEVLPALKAQGVGMVVKPEAPAMLATQLVEAMGLDSNDFLEDYTEDEFKEKAAQVMQKQSQEAQQAKELELAKAQADVGLQQANVAYTQAQARNTMDDNARQMAVAIDRHYQEWADTAISAVKEGANVPPHPTFDEIVAMTKQYMQG